MAQPKSIVRIEKVWKTYTIGENKVHALRGLDLEIKKGEFVAIQGPSGSGKSTAMNMIGALDTPSKGAVYLDGHNIANLSESNLAQIRGKKIGFIFQQFNLIPSLSAVENVMLPLIFQGVSAKEREEKAREALTLVGLGDRMEHRPTELSGGQQQRVAIARALAGEPEMILADEPTGNLDSKTGETFLGFLESLHKEKGKTIVMVTHDANVAKAADRVELLKDGTIIKSHTNRR
ncbi:MAG TPA: ABC transporter ATP-binding protein [Candidatus Nanoarchaeia archaeon]|nr:ABC transporter ATP-binding protein [Candidatus Nanoarchaeia archaeon]